SAGFRPRAVSQLTQLPNPSAQLLNAALGDIPNTGREAVQGSDEAHGGWYYRLHLWWGQGDWCGAAHGRGAGQPTAAGLCRRDASVRCALQVKPRVSRPTSLDGFGITYGALRVGVDGDGVRSVRGVHGQLAEVRINARLSLDLRQPVATAGR